MMHQEICHRERFILDMIEENR